MNLDEIIEKVEALPENRLCRDCADDGPICPNRSLPCDLSYSSIKLLANHAKALAEAVEALRRIERAGSYRDSEISAEALQAISRIKEGR
jgi:hypothetical protein